MTPQVLTIPKRQWRISAVNSSAETALPVFQYKTDTDSNPAEIALRQLNSIFESQGIDEQQYLADFEAGKGSVFEKYYGAAESNA